jgi:hypothetical protein
LGTNWEKSIYIFQSNFRIMKNEKIAVILLIIVIIVSVSVFLTATLGGNIINNLIGEKTEERVIALGDCVDVSVIGRFISDNTMFVSSYNDTTNKTGGTPLNIFISTNTSEDSPTGYTDYTNLINNYYVKGLIEGLVGLKEGDSTTIGPLSPADAYGIYPKAGDNFTIFDPSSGDDFTIQFVNIIDNSTMPEEYVDYYGTNNTTLFVLRINMYTLGEKTTVYPSWKNATIVTKINDTKLWMYTTPSDNQTTNFTWIGVSNDGYTGIVFPENTSSVTSINDTTIIITLNPQIDATIIEHDYYYNSTYYYTVVNLTNEKINVSYVDESTGDSSYYEFNRTIIIVRNESQNITYTYPTQGMEEMLSYFKTNYDPNLVFSVNEYAGKYLFYEVQIEKIYKTS